jgi:hypothetical protein
MLKELAQSVSVDTAGLRQLANELRIPERAHPLTWSGMVDGAGKTPVS